jgi:hypothetical protein
LGDETPAFMNFSPKELVLPHQKNSAFAPHALSPCGPTRGEGTTTGTANAEMPSFETF